jgi:DNA-binding MarR family transcriptional regulator
VSDQNVLAAAPDRDSNDVTPEQHSVIDLLFRAGTSFDGFTAQMRRSFGINAHERLAIAALWERGPLTMTELGAWIPLSRAAVTTLVDRLEGAGLVVRKTDANDRRRTVVHITDEALSRMEPVILPWVGDALRIVEEMGAEKWGVVRDFLTRYMGANQDHAERLSTLSDEQIQALARPRAGA